MSDFKYLFTPIKLGPVELKNRVFMSCMTTNWERGSDQDCAFYEARAKGGAGIVGLACAVTVPFNMNIPGYNTVGTEEGIAQHARVVDAIHRGGAKAFIQAVATIEPQFTNAYPIDLMGGQGRTATKEEIESLFGMVVDSCVRVKATGADAIELPLSSIHNFSTLQSATYDLRTDEFGGSIEQRANVMIDVLRRCREAVGPDFGIGIHPTMDETVVGGDSTEDLVEFYKLVCESGYVDWIRPVGNNIKPHYKQFQYPTSYMPQAINRELAAQVREAMGDCCPVVASAGIRTAEIGEEMLAEGECDMVSMGRALIADPELPNKARAGRSDEICGCIGCAEACYQNFEDSMPIACTVNPEAGLEYLHQVQPAETSKTVLVVGGGACGMEAALVAAQRGHKVTLMERADELGGSVRVHAALPGLSDRRDFINHMAGQLEIAGVDVLLGHEATADEIEGFGADVVLLATGADYSKSGRTAYRMAPVEGAEEADNVLTPEDVVLGGAEVGQHVVVYDSTGYEVGPGLAEMFADQGKEVDYITPLFNMGSEMATNGIDNTLAARVQPKVNFVGETFVEAIDGTTVNIANQFTYEPDEIDDVDTVVMVTTRPSNDELYLALAGRMENVKIIGDAQVSHMGNRCIYHAMMAGRNAALAI